MSASRRVALDGAILGPRGGLHPPELEHEILEFRSFIVSPAVLSPFSLIAFRYKGFIGS